MMNPSLNAYYLIMYSFKKILAIFFSTLILLHTSAALSKENLDEEQVERIIKKQYGEQFSLVKSSVNFITADLNNDKNNDLFAVVTIDEKAKDLNLPKNISIQYPFYQKPESPIQLFLTHRIYAFAVIHGSKEALIGANTQYFLLLGDSPIMIIHPEYSGLDKGKLIKIRDGNIKRNGKKEKGKQVILASEETDGIIYWDGKTYRYEETPDE